MQVPLTHCFSKNIDNFVKVAKTVNRFQLNVKISLEKYLLKIKFKNVQLRNKMLEIKKTFKK